MQTCKNVAGAAAVAVVLVLASVGYHAVATQRVGSSPCVSAGGSN